VSAGTLYLTPHPLSTARTSVSVSSRVSRPLPSSACTFSWVRDVDIRVSINSEDFLKFFLLETSLTHPHVLPCLHCREGVLAIPFKLLAMRD
jgi:hypothetical protein